jgi:hypothetical protein
MLRESMQITGRQVDVRGVTQGFEADVDIPQAAELVEFAEAVVARDEARVSAARAKLLALLGGAGLVDAAAVVGAFHGFVRIADAIGIPYTTAARGADVPDIRERAGVNEFYRVRGTV